jgi:hypothetical protein
VLRVLLFHTMAAPTYSCFIRYNNVNIRIPIENPNITVLEFKQLLFRDDSIAIPVAQQLLIRAGSVMADNQPLADFHLRDNTTVHLVRRRVDTEMARDAAAGGGGENPHVWQRDEFQPLTVIDHELPVLPADLFDHTFYVWCRAASPKCRASTPPDPYGEMHDPRCATARQCDRFVRHRPIGTDAQGDEYPQELQPASARPRCANCKSGSVLVDQRAIPWPIVFSRRVPGECLVCEHRLIEISFICRGELHQRIRFAEGEQPNDPTYVVRSVCRSESLPRGDNFPLPNVFSNSPEQPVVSSDSGEADSVQIAFHPCGHRLNANGLAAYLDSYHSNRRQAIIGNSQIPQVFGAYAVRCCIPDCEHSGIIYLPTCHLAGTERHETVREWGTVETVLSSGGVLCPLAGHQGSPAIMPPLGQPGPKRHCNSCRKDFCEEHRMEWSICEHTMTIDNRIQSSIHNAVLEGSNQRCPNRECTVYGQLSHECCTRITCPSCSTKWCYFCGRQTIGKRAEHNADWETNATHCPKFLDQHPLLDLDPAQALANFHYLRTLRLLRRVRREIEAVYPGEFDIALARLDAAQLTIEVQLEGDQNLTRATAPTITLARLLEPDPVVDCALP